MNLNFNTEIWFVVNNPEIAQSVLQMCKCHELPRFLYEDKLFFYTVLLILWNGVKKTVCVEILWNLFQCVNR